MLAEAHNSRTMVIIHKAALKQKIITLLQENQITALDKNIPKIIFKNIFNK